MRATTRGVRESLPRTFAELCALHLPRPITDDVEYENTVEVIDRLALLPRRTRGQEEYLETLSILIEKYDRDHLVERIADHPIARLERLMENHGMSASDVGRVLGNRSLGPAILRGDRKISRANAAKLGDHFKMSPAAFFQS